MAERPNPGAPSRPFAPLLAAGFGLVAALLVQFGLARAGQSPLVPTYSIAIALAAIAVVLIVFGVRLKRSIADEKRMVDPFHAVRVLVSARAGGIVGGLFSGFGGGLLLSLLGRTVAAPAAIWLPMAALCGAGLILAICAVITEHWCRVPPSDGDGTRASDEGETGPETQTAFRQP